MKAHKQQEPNGSRRRQERNSSEASYLRKHLDLKRAGRREIDQRAGSEASEVRGEPRQGARIAELRQGFAELRQGSAERRRRGTRRPNGGEGGGEQITDMGTLYGINRCASPNIFGVSV
ncbi:hypothetical protein Scep_004282 [Stephania cephalantha]|uniref:Uncharacterized protein n=1 Tax=Stephania cephalantha TaxID=152367 RepID=A0AAP0KS68_9MAGN